ncbi:MAG: FHA domain-containing protein [Myxococcota bacterium]
MLKLVISDDEGQTTVVPLLRDEITIGRQAGNTIRLTERNVSRTHARLVRRNGSYVVEDLGSYNGIRLNGERVDAAAELASGDQLSIGDYALALQADTATSRRPPAEQAESGPPPRLVVMSEPAAGAEFSLGKSIMRIGRDERLDIWINHKSISHEHAEIQVVNGVVTVFDLDSANGIRINGIDTTRAILEPGDVLELGDVGFRLVVPQGTHSLQELPRQMSVAAEVPSPTKKPLFALGVIGLLVLAGAGAVVVTMPSENGSRSETPPASPVAAPPSEPTTIVTVAGTTEAADDAAPSAEIPLDPPPTRPKEAKEAPQEWEELLAQAQAQLARGRVDAAYRIANQLPGDSVLRRTLEYGEIRYRYVQAHIDAGEDALAAGAFDDARREARLVLGIPRITNKQRRDARRILTNAKPARSPRPAGTKRPSPEEALAEAHRCVSTGDNACVIRALEAGQARSPAALALLIETYRAMDDLPAARRHMRAFVQRYPGNSRTPRYQQMLGSD